MAAELTTAALFALAREARPFCRRVRGLVRWSEPPFPAWRAPGGLLVAQTGMGAGASRMAVDWLVAHAPSLRRVVLGGFCGGLVEGFRVGDLVQPDTILSPEGGRLPVVPSPRVARPVTLISVASPLYGVAERRLLHETSGAAVVDMESAAVAERCGAAGVTFSCLRVVSDDVVHPLPPELAEMMEGERLLVRRLLRAVVRRPGLVGDLVRLARDTRRAADVLAKGTEALLDTPG